MDFMENEIEALQAEIKTLQQRLESKLDERRNAGSFTTDAGKVKFDEQTSKDHVDNRSALFPYIMNLSFGIHISTPVVYAMIIPIAFLDLCVSIFQAICFRLWKVDRAKRSDWIVVDRHHLAYLNRLEKLNCIFCGYANGVFAFAVEVAARTEEFWCPIKHAKRINQPHSRYDAYIEFGDVKSWSEHPSRKLPK